MFQNWLIEDSDNDLGIHNIEEIRQKTYAEQKLGIEINLLGFWQIWYSTQCWWYVHESLGSLNFCSEQKS